MENIRKNDEVLVLTGRDKGKKGKVERVLAKDSAVIIAGINIYKKHKKDQNSNGIIDIVKPLGLNKVALVCPKCHKPTRVSFQVVGDNKNRVCKKCGEVISV